MNITFFTGRNLLIDAPVTVVFRKTFFPTNTYLINTFNCRGGI